jgi:hypothetical protein
MPTRLFSMALCAALLAIPCAAFAEDGGEAGVVEDAAAEAEIKDAARDADGASSAEEDAGDASAASDGPVAIVACDGALCDTTQGRPVCDVVAPLGHSPFEITVGFALGLPLVLGVLRRARRGASRPGTGGRV